MSNYPAGVTDDDPHFTDESEPEDDEEPEGESDVTSYHYGREEDV